MKEDQNWASGLPSYTEKQWHDELRAQDAPFGIGKALPCPKCGVVGFYAPKITLDESRNVTRKYRACKYCGIWQEAWGEVFDERGGGAYRCIATICQCPYPSKYDWQDYKQPDIKTCGNCHAEKEQTQWASDNPSHPFRQIRDEIARLLKLNP